MNPESADKDALLESLEKQNKQKVIDQLKASYSRYDDMSPYLEDKRHTELDERAENVTEGIRQSVHHLPFSEIENEFNNRVSNYLGQFETKKYDQEGALQSKQDVFKDLENAKKGDTLDIEYSYVSTNEEEWINQNYVFKKADSTLYGPKSVEIHKIINGTKKIQTIVPNGIKTIDTIYDESGAIIGIWTVDGDGDSAIRKNEEMKFIERDNNNDEFSKEVLSFADKEIKETTNDTKSKVSDATEEEPESTKSAEEDSANTQLDYLQYAYRRKAEKNVLNNLSKQAPPMNEKCKIAINLPAYKEGPNIYNCLLQYTKQKDKNGNQLDPELFEINILLNRPNNKVEFDEKTENEIKKFQKKFPNFRVNLFKHTFDFDKAPKMGTIYKTAADIALFRSLKRKKISNINRLILRTGGADAKEKNPQFIANILKAFEDPNVAVYKSESRYPKEILEKCPLLHTLYTIESGLNRLYTKGQSNIGLGSYSAEIYALAGGFNRDKFVAEEVDLANRIRQETKNPLNEDRLNVKRNLVKNAIDDPRRAIFSLWKKQGMANKYSTFGDNATEDELRNIDWNSKLLSEELPEHMKLSAKNLERELSLFYRQYLNRTMFQSETIKKYRKESPQPTKEDVRQKTYEVTNRLFSRILTLIGLKTEDFQFIQRNGTKSKASIQILNIDRLNKIIEDRTFKSHEVF